MLKRDYIHTSFDVMNQWEAMRPELETISKANDGCFMATALEIWIERHGHDRNLFADLTEYALNVDGCSKRALTVLHHRPPKTAPRHDTGPWEDDIPF